MPKVGDKRVTRMPRFKPGFPWIGLVSVEQVYKKIISAHGLQYTEWCDLTDKEVPKRLKESPKGYDRARGTTGKKRRS